MPENDGGNGRVTVAVLAEKIDNFGALLTDVRADIRVVKAEVNDSAKDREERLRKLETERVPAIESRVGLVEERQSTQARNQTIFAAIYATVASAIAGVIGRSQ